MSVSESVLVSRLSLVNWILLYVLCVDLLYLYCDKVALLCTLIVVSRSISSIQMSGNGFLGQQRSLELTR